MFRELLGSDDLEEQKLKKVTTVSTKPPVDPSLWKQNKKGRKKKHSPEKKEKEKPTVQIPNIIKCLKHGTKDEEESNLEDFITTTFQNQNKDQIQSFIPENDNGNIEYKLKLINPSSDRVDQLTTQMKFRLAEGFGEAYYRIGVEDNGRPTGLSKEDMFQSLKTICKIAHRLKTDVIVLRMTQGIKGKVAQLMVRKANAQGVKLQIKVLMFGQSGCGKSTLVGVLKSGEKDDGNGLARVKVFTHKNQILTGITQSVSHEVIGFDSNGNIVNKSMISSWENMLHQSTKILTLIDVGGHKKAQKQVVSSLCSFFPEYAIMVISAVSPKLPPEQIQLATIFNIPIIIVITHIDKVSQSDLKNTIINTKLDLEQSEKIPSVVKTMEEAVLFSRAVATQAITPIFPLSSVTGQNLDIFTAFLNLLPAVSDIRNNTQMNTQFLISDKFVIDGKIILAGTVIKGNIKTGQVLHIGPDAKGTFRGVEIINVRCMRVPVMYAKCGQTCTLAIKPLNLCKEWLEAEPNGIRRGMVLVESKIDPKAAYEFEVELTTFGTNQPTIITNKYQPVVNSLTTRQICTIVRMKPQIQKQQKNPSNKKKSRSIGGRTSFKESALSNSKTTKNFKSKQSCSFLSEELAQIENEKKTQKKQQPKVCVLDQIVEEGPRRRKLKQELVIMPNKPNSLRLRFKYYPEYITLGQKLIINEQLLKAVGKITKIYY